MSNSDDMSDSVSLSETPQSLSSDSMRSPCASYYSGARRLSGPGGASFSDSFTFPSGAFTRGADFARPEQVRQPAVPTGRILLGEGAFGRVYEMDIKVAVKKMKSIIASDQVIQEVDILMNLNHPHVIKAYSHHYEVKSIIILSDMVNILIFTRKDFSALSWSTLTGEHWPRLSGMRPRFGIYDVFYDCYVLLISFLQLTDVTSYQNDILTGSRFNLVCGVHCVEVSLPDGRCP